VAAPALALAAFLAWPWYHERAEFRQAMNLAREKCFDEALPVLLRFHERHPESVAAVRALALGYLHNTKRLAETRQYLDQWCQIAPDDPEPYRQRLSFWMMQEMVSPAIADAERVVQLAPDDFKTRGKLVQLLLTDGRYQQAEEQGLLCFRHDPDDVDLWLVLANIYYGLGQAKKTADLVDQVLKVDPDRLAALKLRAKLYVEANQPEPAIRLLRERVVRKNSEDGTQGLYELSEALSRAGRRDEAKKALAELDWRLALGLWSKYEHRDENPGLQERVVRAMLAAGETEQAVNFLTGILERNPKAPPHTHELLALCYEKQVQAAAEQRRLAERKPEEGQGRKFTR
jgi:tetratricopeptide (TPR) repeat protein